MTDYFDAVGFSSNPFASYAAENEPEIESYIVKPPFYATVGKRARSTSSFILFGGRGQGKSATRIGLYQDLWNATANGESMPLAVTMDSFARILSKGFPVKDGLPSYLKELGYLVCEALLVWLSALPDGERDLRVQSLHKTELGVAVSLIDRFYLSHPEITRRVSARSALIMLNQAWPKRTQMWAQKRWDGLVDIVHSIGQALVKAKTDLEVDVADDVKSLVSAPDASWSNADYARAVLGRLVEVAKQFGFSGVVVLVDKVDETEHTNNSAEASAVLMHPILANTQLLEVEHFGFIFFLWDQVASHYRSLGES